MAQIFERMKLVPTLSFVDPWGYKGLTLRLVNALIKDWGCDCIFFFNYNRINMGLSNDFVKEHIDAIFGETRGEELRILLEPLSPSEREFKILEELTKALQAKGGKYVLPFRFKNAQGQRTSHHLVLVSKSFKGYDIMKGIMAGQSSKSDQGVPSFEYNAADEKFPLLFELTRPLAELGPMLMKSFAGQALTMKRLYEEHSVGLPYIRKNYVEVLLHLEAGGEIRVSSVDRPSRRGTLADWRQITFPQ